MESIRGKHRWKASAVFLSPRGLQAPEAPSAAAWEGVPAVCQGETEADTWGGGSAFSWMLLPLCNTQWPLLARPSLSQLQVYTLPPL